jgi:hypothetical protein
MKWILALLVIVVVVIASLPIVGARIANSPRSHDPFPDALRAELRSLNDERREIEWLAANARLVGQATKLPQEKQDYDELANEANAWLSAAAQGLKLDQIDTVGLTKQFQERLMPKAKELTATLTSKMRWIGPQRLDAGILKWGTTEIDHIIAVLANTWNDVGVHFKFAQAGNAESKKIAMNELDDMKWLPWSELMAEQF